MTTHATSIAVACSSPGHWRPLVLFCITWIARPRLFLTAAATAYISCDTVFGYFPVYCQVALLPDAEMPISLDDMTEQDLRDFLRQHQLKQLGDDGTVILKIILSIASNVIAVCDDEYGLHDARLRILHNPDDDSDEDEDEDEDEEDDEVCARLAGLQQVPYWVRVVPHAPNYSTNSGSRTFRASQASRRAQSSSRTSHMRRTARHR